MDTKFLSWFLEGGSVALPKRLLAYLEPLNLSFEELGEIVYLFSLEARVPSGNIRGKSAAADLVKKRLITYNVDTGVVSFAPLFDRMLSKTTAGEEAQAQGNPIKEDSITTLNEVVKRYEVEKGIIIPSKARQDLSEIILRYGWDSDLVYNLYVDYMKKQRNHYSLLSYAQNAHVAGVVDSETFKQFSVTQNYEMTKIREVLRKLGIDFRQPTEVERRNYSQWVHEWGFSHEMVMMALDDTLSARNPTFSYVGKILKNWFEEGIKTPQQVTAYRVKREKQKNTSKKSGYQKKLTERYVNPNGPRDFSGREE